MKRTNAFTLIELLVTMAIIAILIGIGIWGINQGFRSSRDEARKSIAQEVVSGIDSFKGQHLALPTAASSITSFDNSIITLSKGTQKSKINIKYEVKIVSSSSTAYTQKTAYVCVKFGTPSGYAVGVLLETGWYYPTQDKCFLSFLF